MQQRPYNGVVVTDIWGHTYLCSKCLFAFVELGEAHTLWKVKDAIYGSYFLHDLVPYWNLREIWIDIYRHARPWEFDMSKYSDFQLRDTLVKMFAEQELWVWQLTESSFGKLPEDNGIGDGGLAAETASPAPASKKTAKPGGAAADGAGDAGAAVVQQTAKTHTSAEVPSAVSAKANALKSDDKNFKATLSDYVRENIIDQSTSDKLHALVEAGVVTPLLIKQGLENNSLSAVEPGQKGNWNKVLNKALQANHTYLVGDYLYETDDIGRIKRVSGELNLDMRDRNTYQQGKSANTDGIKDGLSDDDGGHLIASIFDGAGEQINYAPMNSNLNRGAWKCMENEWAEALKSEPPKEVKVEIRPVYDEGINRPTSFIVNYTIDGKPYKKRFKNKSSKG